MLIQNELNKPFIIDDTEYIALRDRLSNLLLTFFEAITFKDAAENDCYISFIGTRYHANKMVEWQAVSVYHAKEWYEYYEAGIIEQRFDERLQTIRIQHHHATGKQ